MSELSELANEFRDHALRFNERVARLERGRFFSGQSAIFSLARAKAQILAINRSVDVDGRTVLELEIRATTNELGLHYFERERGSIRARLSDADPEQRWTKYLAAC